MLRNAFHRPATFFDGLSGAVEIEQPEPCQPGRHENLRRLTRQATSCANGGATHQVRANTGLLQRADHTDMRPAARGTAAQRETDARRAWRGHAAGPRGVMRRISSPVAQWYPAPEHSGPNRQGVPAPGAGQRYVWPGRGRSDVRARLRSREGSGVDARRLSDGWGITAVGAETISDHIQWVARAAGHFTPCASSESNPARSILKRLARRHHQRNRQVPEQCCRTR